MRRLRPRLAGPVRGEEDTIGAHDDPETDALLHPAAEGDGEALRRLLERHRRRLRQMVAVRLDRRLAARLDPSDVVQEALADAGRKLGAYVRDRPLAFYPWLRRLAAERLVQAHRHHLRADKRSVGREAPDRLPLPDESAVQLVDRLVASGTSPSRRLIVEERRLRVRRALERLPDGDREVLVLRYLEDLAFGEVADVMGISENAAKVRHFRALKRIRRLLDDESRGVLG